MIQQRLLVLKPLTPTLGSNQQAEQPSQQQQELDMNAEDIDNMDSVPFDDEIANENLEEEFHDCGTWNEDDSDEIIPTGIIQFLGY